MNIQYLKLLSNNLTKQRQFYSQLLGLKLREDSSTHFSVSLGNSILEFHLAENATPYHFAINIPSNQESQALAWLKQSVEILTGRGEEIHDFGFWNAKAIYFYDEDQNIVEFIARKNLKNESALPFSAKSLLSIIEIGLPTSDIQSIYQQFHHATGAEIFSGSLEQFCAIGDEHALLICINKNIRKWYPMNDDAFSSSFSASVIVDGNAFELSFENDHLAILENN